MKILPLLLISVVVSLQGTADVPYLANEFDPTKWPEAHLTLSQAGTVKDVFDSGLRPYRHPGVETSTLEVKHLRLFIQLASGKTLPEIQCEWMQFKPYADGEIAAIEGATPKLTLEESRAEMTKWLPYGTRTDADLDAYLKAVEADFLDFDDPYRGRPDGCGLGWNEPNWKQRGGGPKCGVGFRKTASQSHPLRLYFHLSWGLNRTMKDSVFYKIPIPPPPGYEHVSMDAPKNFGPDSMVDILRAKGVDIGESTEAKGARAMEEARAAEQARGATKPAAPSPESAKRPSVWYILTVIAFALAAIAVWRRFRKNKDDQ